MKHILTGLSLFTIPTVTVWATLTWSTDSAFNMNYPAWFGVITWGAICLIATMSSISDDREKRHVRKSDRIREICRNNILSAESRCAMIKEIINE